MKTIYEFLKKVAFFCCSRCLPIEGTFSQTLYNLRIFVLINERMKYFSIFVAGFSCFHRLPIERINIFVHLKKKFPTNKMKRILSKVQKTAVLAGYQLRRYFIAGQI